MSRYDELRQMLLGRRLFKLVCGAGNEDIKEVRRLATIYTLAGAKMLDLSANLEVVEAAKKGVDIAYERAKQLSRHIGLRPYLNVSIGLKGDPHARKAVIDKGLCTNCGLCFQECGQEAISENFEVKEYRCIGCGDCQRVCQSGAISYVYRKADFEKILPECVKLGVENMELHAVTDDEEDVFSNWKMLNKIIRDNYISICMDRNLLSNKRFLDRVSKAYEITGERFVVQADGVPMGGEGDDYNTTLQAVACADIVQKSGLPVMMLLSGGTNSKTGLLARQCGVRANGIAVGSWARKIVREFVKKEEFDFNIDVVTQAVSLAEKLIKSNIEAISDSIKN